VLETTALGAALLAGLGVGLYGNLDETAKGWHVADTFAPQMDSTQRESLLSGWQRAVRSALFWAGKDA
jgi:glycerol kinase